MTLILRLAAAVSMMLLVSGGSCGPPTPAVEVGSACSEGEVGEKTCNTYDANDILICSADLHWRVDTACYGDFGMFCDSVDGEPICVPIPCDSGDSRCSPGNEGIRVCDDDGDWVDSETCSEGTECGAREYESGLVLECVPVTCREGDTRCADDDTKVETCGAENDWTPTATCEAGQICRVVSDDAECVVEALRIIQVKWEWGDPCSYQTPSDVTITTIATPTGLSYSGSVSDCTGSIDASVAVLTCRNETLMSGSVTVTDSENNKEEVTFAFDACIDGRVCADGQPCCTEGTSRCTESGDEVEQCEADGSWEVVDTCDTGLRCYLDGQVAECRAAECIEGDLRCFESDGWPGTDIEYCLNGTWVFSQSCQQRPNQSRPDWVCIINDNLDPPVYYCG